ncbi:hypothetical protein DSTSK_00540 [Desulforhabdus sp. TSK]|nr:hypothetical protein DSTSK_00540 [Desulforhabdus sp. TSK]
MNCFNVRLRKITSLEKKGFAGRLCKSIGTAVAYIESRRMSAFAVLSPRRSCDFQLLNCQAKDFNLCMVDEKIQLTPPKIALHCFYHNSGL